MNLERIDFLLPRTSQYGVLHHFTRKLYEAFQRAGYTCRLIDIHIQLEITKRDPPDLTVGFNGVPRNESGELLCDFLRVPHLACLVDPPYRFLYLYKSPFVITACDDQSGCQFLKKMGIEKQLFLPHAVEAELLEEEREEPCFDIVLLATFIDFEKRRLEWRKKYSHDICQAMDQAIEVTFSEKKISFIQALDDALKEKPENIDQILEDLELYVKGRDRFELVKAVKDHPLHIFGNSIDNSGWKSIKNVLYHGPVNYPQAIQIMKKSKILLNPSLKNKEGAHERIFTGIACGACVVTNESQYILERFEDDLIYYRHPHLEEINEGIETYLSDESKRQELVKRGCQKILKGETWDHRVILLENFLMS